MKKNVSPRKEPKQDRSKELVSAVLKATKLIMLDTGTKSVTTAKVAKKAGVSVGSLYQYFPNKESLISLVIEDHFEKMKINLMNEMNHLEGESLKSKLHSIVSRLIEVHLEDKDILIALEDYSGELGLKVSERERQDSWIVFVQKILREHDHEIRNINYEVAAFMITYSIDNLIHEAIYRDASFIKGNELGDEIFNMVYNYLTISAK